MKDKSYSRSAYSPNMGMPSRARKGGSRGLTGLLAGIAAIMYVAVNTKVTTSGGDTFNNNAIAACVMGGTSMAGGSGKLGGTLIGALIIGILNNGLNLMGVNSDWQFIIKGGVILGAVYMDFIRSQKKAK